MWLGRAKQILHFWSDLDELYFDLVKPILDLIKSSFNLGEMIFNLGETGFDRTQVDVMSPIVLWVVISASLISYNKN